MYLDNKMDNDPRHNDEKIMYMLGEINSSVKSINEKIASNTVRIDKHDYKMDILEKWQDNITGKFAVIAIILSIAITLFGGWVRSKLGF